MSSQNYGGFKALRHVSGQFTQVTEVKELKIGTVWVRLPPPAPTYREGTAFDVNKVGRLCGQVEDPRHLVNAILVVSALRLWALPLHAHAAGDCPRRVATRNPDRPGAVPQWYPKLPATDVVPVSC